MSPPSEKEEKKRPHCRQNEQEEPRKERKKSRHTICSIYRDAPQEKKRNPSQQLEKKAGRKKRKGKKSSPTAKNRRIHFSEVADQIAKNDVKRRERIKRKEVLTPFIFPQRALGNQKCASLSPMLHDHMRRMGGKEDRFILLSLTERMKASPKPYPHHSLTGKKSIRHR